MSEHVVSSEDSWSKAAAGLKRTAFEGPTVRVNEDLLETLNSTFPLSRAKAILDNGCGVGQVIGRMIERYGTKIQENTRLVASDSSAGMIGELQQRQREEVAQGSRPWARVEGQIYDAQDLREVPDNSFTHVTAGLLMFMLPRPRDALNEIRRVLSEEDGGGAFGLTSFQSVGWMEMFGIYAEVRRGTQFPQAPKEWSSVDSVREELKATGFRDVECHEVLTHYEFWDAAETVDLFLQNVPSVQSVVKDLSNAELMQGRDLIIQHLNTTYPSKPGRIPGVAIVAVARK